MELTELQGLGTHSWKAVDAVLVRVFLCGDCMLPQCLRGFSTGTRDSCHSRRVCANTCACCLQRSILGFDRFTGCLPRSTCETFFQHAVVHLCVSTLQCDDTTRHSGLTRPVYLSLIKRIHIHALAFLTAFPYSSCR